MVQRRVYKLKIEQRKRGAKIILFGQSARGTSTFISELKGVNLRALKADELAHIEAHIPARRNPAV